MSVKDIRKLTDEYKYKIDFHVHTSPASPCSDVTSERTVETYAKLGFDGIVITNHFVKPLLKSDNPNEVRDTYLSDYYRAKSLGEKLGLKVYLGMEIRCLESANDYLIYGIGDDDIKTITAHIEDDFITFYKAFKSDKNLILQAHPFRDGMTRQDARFIDGIESFNVHQGHNSRNGFANKYANEHKNFVKTCGSDFHHLGNEGLGAVRMKTLPDDSFGLVEVIKSGDYLLDVAGSIVIP